MIDKFALLFTHIGILVLIGLMLSQQHGRSRDQTPPSNARGQNNAPRRRGRGQIAAGAHRMQPGAVRGRKDV